MNDAEEVGLAVATAHFEREFCDTGAFGVIEDGDGKIVWVTLLTDTGVLSPRRKQLFTNVDDDKAVILVGYEYAERLPATHAVPPESEDVTFPKTFRNLPVVYQRVTLTTLKMLSNPKPPTLVQKRKSA